jgi:DNA-binding GntR family transcriptional regulator
MLVTLQLQPGGILSEGELSARIGIGRTPLREALQRLAVEGLVTALPRRGILVREITVAEHLAILETRRVLDRLLASLAAARAGASERRALEHCADELARAAATHALTRFLDVDRRFDGIVETAAHNPAAVRAAAPLHVQGRRFWYKYRHDGDLAAAARLHVALVRAIASGRRRNAAVASDALLDYLERFTRASLDHFGKR